MNMSLMHYRKKAFINLFEEDIKTACDALWHVALKNKFAPNDCGNLAFVLFNYATKELQESIYKRISSLTITDPVPTCVTWLILSLELNLDKQDAEQHVEDSYIRPIVRPNTRTDAGKPIVFWHIPKCSGTSITKVFSDFFYKAPLGELVPGYQYKPLVTYLARCRLPEFPFFPSQHFGQDELHPTGPQFSFTIMRDPLKRCLSMYRQMTNGNRGITPRKLVRLGYNAIQLRWLGTDFLSPACYRVFPSYGYLWDFRHSGNVDRWTQNMDKILLLRQLSTFNDDLDIQEAVRRVGNLDYLIIRDYSFGSEAELFDLLGLPIDTGSIPKNMNRSSRKIKIKSHEAEYVRQSIQPEYDVLAALARQSP